MHNEIEDGIRDDSLATAGMKLIEHLKNQSDETGELCLSILENMWKG